MTAEPPELTDDIRADSGRVDAVVRWQRPSQPRAPGIESKSRAATILEAGRAGLYHAGRGRFDGAGGAMERLYSLAFSS
jgi:hypothetical protein